jgi:signal transduction histidine kinase
MKANRTKMLGTIALVAVLCMQLFWIYNSFQMSVHQMGYDNPWSLAADVRAHAFFSALYQSRITLLTSLLTTVVIILSLIDQINYIDEQERVRLLREDFSYAMVHDMKSPLTSIIMGTKYLHSDVLEKKPEMKEKEV